MRTWLTTSKTAREFPNQEALQKYLKAHPKADKSNHKVVEVKDVPEGVKVTAPKETLVKFQGDIPEYNLEIIADAGDGEKVSGEDLKRARAIKEKLKKGISDSADVCKLSPSVCSQNLGIDRANMPQIMEDSIKSLLASKKPADVAKGKAAVDAGADPDDDEPMTKKFMAHLKDKGVKITTGQRVPVGQLKATQKEIKAGKTFGMADAFLTGKFDPSKSPIIVSKDGYILDGHHRWAAMLTVNPKAKMNVTRVDMDMRDMLDESFNMPGVYRADLQDKVVPGDKPLDLARKPGSTWQQKGKWYAKNNDKESAGPFKDQDAAKAFASGKKEAPADDKGKKTAGDGSDLRRAAIRLAFINPDLRPTLLPLLARTAMPAPPLTAADIQNYEVEVGEQVSFGHKFPGPAVDAAYLDRLDGRPRSTDLYGHLIAVAWREIQDKPWFLRQLETQTGTLRAATEQKMAQYKDYHGHYVDGPHGVIRRTAKTAADPVRDDLEMLDKRLIKFRDQLSDKYKNWFLDEPLSKEDIWKEILGIVNDMCDEVTELAAKIAAPGNPIAQLPRIRAIVNQMTPRRASSPELRSVVSSACMDMRVMVVKLLRARTQGRTASSVRRLEVFWDHGLPGFRVIFPDPHNQTYDTYLVGSNNPKTVQALAAQALRAWAGSNAGSLDYNALMEFIDKYISEQSKGRFTRIRWNMKSYPD